MGSVWLTRVQFFSLAETATKPSCARNLSKNHVWTRGKGSRRTHRTKKRTPHLTLCFPPPDCRGAQAERVGRCWCLLATKNHSKNQRQKGGRGFQLQEGRGMWNCWPQFWFCSARFWATRCCCCRSPKKPQNHRRLVERFRGARDGDELTYLICVSCTPPPPPPPLRIPAARGDDLNQKNHNEIQDQPPWIENDTAREETLTWVWSPLQPRTNSPLRVQMRAVKIADGCESRWRRERKPRERRWVEEMNRRATWCFQ